MPVKKPAERTKQLTLRSLGLTMHWRLDICAKDLNLSKEEAAQKILEDFLKRTVKLEVEA